MSAEIFIGRREAGEIHGTLLVLGNFNHKKDAVALSAVEAGSLVDGYLHGKYQRGWLVLRRLPDSEALP